MTKRITADHVKLKRAYEPAATDDGTRILVDRLWPRGVKKADAAIDQWVKDIAPARPCEVHNDAVALRNFLLGRETKRKAETAHR